MRTLGAAALAALKNKASVQKKGKAKMILGRSDDQSADFHSLSDAIASRISNIETDTGRGMAGVFLMNTKGYGPMMLEAEEASRKFGLPIVPVVVTSDMTRQDLTSFSFNKSGGLTPITIFDEYPEGGIFLLKDTEIRPDLADYFNDMAHGNVASVPALQDVDLSKWFFVVAADSPGQVPALLRKNAISIKLDAMP